MPAAVAIPAAISTVGMGVNMFEANKSRQQASDQYNQGLAQTQAQQEAQQAAAAPYMDAGAHAAQQLQQGTAPGGALVRQIAPADLSRTPAEIAIMRAAQKAVGNSASARGGSISGMAVNDMMKLASNYAGNDVNNLTNLFSQNQRQQMSGLNEIANMGNTATNNMGRYNVETNNSILGMRNNLAYTNASANMANAKAITGGLSTIGNSVSDYMKTQQQPQQQPQVIDLTGLNANNNAGLSGGQINYGAPGGVLPQTPLASGYQPFGYNLNNNSDNS